MKEVKQAITLLENKVVQINQAIRALRHLDDFAVTNRIDGRVNNGKKRVISASARRKMALAQRARWQRVRAEQKGKKAA